MKYGIYLDGEVMTTNEDYFKVLEEAEYLTKETGVEFPPIKDTKWSEQQRIKTHIRYVEDSEKKIMKLESDYIKAQESLRKIIERIEIGE
jgi:hypothetical protein